ncbi:MAG: aldolase/citrate lyase family protein [Dehalococcoidia bacterium]|nr:aldolase/citrate lyase family protein [Dehalococcoidia bacterium]MDW8119558.1 aldolase/citrate lyase family protein [Chloroflexota bacterium]
MAQNLPRVRRSVLIMPVNVPRFIERAWTRNADAITLDLEDAVAPTQKAHARTLVKDAIPTVAAGGAEVGVRINHGTPREDCQASVWPGLAYIAFPKAESAQEVHSLDAILTALEQERGLPPGFIEIQAMIETAQGVWNAYAIASASPRIRQFGGVSPGDLTADLGIHLEAEVDVLAFARGWTDLVARAVGKEVTSGVWSPGPPFGYADREALRKREEVKRRAGFRTGGGIHPAQVEAANAGLTPTPQEVAQAQRILHAFATAWAQGEAYAVVDGRLVDRRVAEALREYLAFAQACARKDAHKRQMQEAMRQKEKA